jgi:tetrapyrrole methylase family protein/MazG family protein
MKRRLLEECHELIEAIEMDKPELIVEELGDVLFHLAFQVRLGEESGQFTDDHVFGTAIRKFVRRHTHVFGSDRLSNTREAEAHWSAHKREDRADASTSVVDGVPEGLPTLARTQSIQERAAWSGFDWEDVESVVEKVKEELAELHHSQTLEEREAELGDVLFALVNVGRWLGMDAEAALRQANTRFRDRFVLMEDLSSKRGLHFDELLLEEKEALWQEAKRLLTRREK